MSWYSKLDPKTHETLSKFKKLGVAALEVLKEQFPDQLIVLIEAGDLSEADLSFAAELLGELNSDFSDKVRRVAIPLLSHSSPSVREGAIYALEGVHSNSVVRFKLLEMSSKDTSKGIREICSRIINNIGVVKAF